MKVSGLLFICETSMRISSSFLPRGCHSNPELLLPTFEAQRQHIPVVRSVVCFRISPTFPGEKSRGNFGLTQTVRCFKVRLGSVIGGVGWSVLLGGLMFADCNSIAIYLLCP